MNKSNHANIEEGTEKVQKRKEKKEKNNTVKEEESKIDNMSATCGME